MIRTGDYSIADIKSFFTRRYEEVNDDYIEIGEIIKMQVSNTVDIVVEIIDIEDGGLLVVQILEVNGYSDEHVEGDIIFVPSEILKG